MGPHVGSKAREVMMELEEWEALKATEKPGGAMKPSDMYDHENPPPVDTSWD